jgi:hypothetical protein
MHFDVPKVVRSPGCDHGHDKESRNGRDIKIDILEAYVWTSEVFRVKSGFYRVTGRVTGTPREPYGPSWALVERRKGQPKVAAPLPPPLVLLGLGEGGRPPSLPSPPRNPSWTRIGGRNPTPRGSRTLLRLPLWPASLPSSPPLYTEAGAPLNKQVNTS